MTTRVQKWGNSLAVRIPKAYADEIGLREDASVELNVAEGMITISLQIVNIPTLEELLAGITPENIHPETDWGPPVGNEVW